MLQTAKAFKVFKSSAGSGKTYTLTKEYLKLALLAPYTSGGEGNGRYFKHILAVTFTNDAANEMKNRIMKQLSAFAKSAAPQEDQLLKDISQEVKVEYGLEISPEELSERAKVMQVELLHNYSDFAVSTIDKFNKRIVDAFKKDLNLPFDYELILEQDELLEEAVDKLLLQAGAVDKALLTEVLVRFTKQQIADEKSWAIGGALQKIGEKLFKEDSQKELIKLQDIGFEVYLEAVKIAGALLKDAEKAIAAPAKEALAAIENAGFQPLDFTRGKSGIGAYFLAYANDPFEKLFEENSPNSYHRQAIEEGKWFSKTAAAKFEERFAPIETVLVLCFHAVENAKALHRERVYLSRGVKENAYLLATLSELKKIVEEIKGENNQVHISDFNLKINEVVEQEPVPYLFERLGERYHHILIDEFQDTSVMQWHNLLPLLANGLAKQMGSLVVGDAKQAIYRWRSGRAEMLVDLPKLPTVSPSSPLAAEVGIFEQHHNQNTLATNWRSAGEVVKFNNAFFKFMMENIPFEKVQNFYGEVNQLANGEAVGTVKVDLLSNNIKKKVSKDAYFARVLVAIRALQAEGVPLRDMAILVRGNKEGAFLAENLMNEKIDIISGDSLLLNASPSVRFIIHFFRAFLYPENPQHKMDVFRFLLHRYPRKTQGKSKGELIEAFAKKAVVTESAIFFEALEEIFGLSLDMASFSFQSIYEMAEELIRVFGLNEQIGQQAYLQKLLDLLQARTGKLGGSLDDFLEYWKRKGEKLSISTPDTGNAIRIMTIHKSKGLEFPAVIMPFVNWQGKTSDELWLDLSESPFALPTCLMPVNSGMKTVKGFSDKHGTIKEAVFLDDLNVLYVGMTRPVNYLHIIAEEKEPKDGEFKTVNQLLTRFCGAEQLVEELVFWNDETEEVLLKAYEWGTPIETTFAARREEPEKEVLKERSVLHIGAPVHANNRHRIKLRKETVSEAGSELSLAEVIGAKEKGVLVHYAFEKIKYSTDLPKAIQALVAEGWVTASEAHVVGKQMEKVMALPEIAPYYDPSASIRVRNEQELLVKDGGRNIMLRPDRLVVRGKTLVIIDYKTGREKLNEHRHQVGQYAAALAQMGYTDILKYLVYTEVPMAVKV